MSIVRRVFSERRAVLVPLTLFLVINVLVLALVVWPLRRTVAGAQEAQYQAAQSVEAARKLESQIKGQRASKELADIELRKFYGEILPKDYRGAIGVTNFFLNGVAQSTRVTFRAGSWDREQVRESQLNKLTGQVTLIGEYANIRRFLYEVETAEEFVVIESVELSQASALQNENQLELALVVATYFMDSTPRAVAR
jgi:hypothetical protein